MPSRLPGTSPKQLPHESLKPSPESQPSATSMAHLADAKSLLDSRGLYEGATVHGVNPLLLVEKIIRERIFESLYWKEQSFGLNGKLFRPVRASP